jgi:hypothetical protein
MTRSQLEHLIGAAGTIADDDDIVVICSQAILGQFPRAPEEFLVSREADLYPRNHPDRADLIDGSIGEASPFERAYGYYAHGVGPETAILPDGWQTRLIPIAGPNTRSVRGWCLEVHDLAIAKLAAGREKDLNFAAALARHRMVNPETLLERLAATDLDPALRPLLAARLSRFFDPPPHPVR